MAAWPEVLDELVRTRRSSLVGYAALLTGDLPAAEDVVHDAILKSFSRGRRFAHVNLAEAYVRRAIVSVFIDGARRERRFREAAPVLARADAGAGPESSADLDKALASLSPQLRAAVVLRFVDDLTVPQIAERLRLAQGTVKRYLHDAQAALAIEYQEEHEALDVNVVVHGERSAS